MNIISSSPDTLVVALDDEADTVALGGLIGKVLAGDSFTIFLHGDLGAGKTTLSRGIVQSFGYSGAVKSPTYTLVEPYELAQQNIYHFDLYRMASAEELHYLGLEDYFNQPRRLCLVEWPEKAEGALPQPDWVVELHYHGEGQHQARCITIALNDGAKDYEQAQQRLQQLAQNVRMQCQQQLHR